MKRKLKHNFLTDVFVVISLLVLVPPLAFGLGPQSDLAHRQHDLLPGRCRCQGGLRRHRDLRFPHQLRIVGENRRGQFGEPGGECAGRGARGALRQRARWPGGHPQSPSPDGYRGAGGSGGPHRRLARPARLPKHGRQGMAQPRRALGIHSRGRSHRSGTMGGCTCGDCTLANPSSRSQPATSLCGPFRSISQASDW